MKKLIVSVCIGCGVIAAAVMLLHSPDSGRVYAKLCSPDLQYSVTVKADPFSFTPRFPGQGSDAPGKIFLYDEVEKKPLGSASIPLLWMAYDLIWTNRTAYFVGEGYPNILDPWILPREMKGHGTPREKSVRCPEN